MLMIQILATACDRTLGGREFDLVLFDHFAKEIKARRYLAVFLNKILIDSISGKIQT